MDSRTMKILGGAITAALASAGTAQADTELLWGDTHLHTQYSTDAFFLGNRTGSPEVAYRWAKGLPVIHPYNRAKVSIDKPLDFLVVSDHAKMLGIPLKLFAGNPTLAQTPTGKRYLEMAEQGRGKEIFMEFLRSINNPEGGKALADLNNPKVLRSNWEEIVDAAERHNEPGKFTALIGWEWTSTPDGSNLHRVIMTPTDGETAKKFFPYSAMDSSRPEDLWAWLDKTAGDLDIDFVAIPHNSNISKSRMFASIDSDGRPIDADYARTRARWEPVVEVTQIKGDSETHPALSPNDEFADFEYFNRLIEARPGKRTEPTNTPADYVRPALKRGLAIAERTGVNPYKLGMIGSTDSHTGLSSMEEDNFWGKMAIDSIPENKKEGFAGLSGWEMSAAGIAGVWAEENTREAIVAAFRRREVYGTTGPRMRVRFFGGFAFTPKDMQAAVLSEPGYAKGVPMGGDLTAAPQGQSPSFLIHAAMEPGGAHLDRVQVIKGWLDASGEQHEKIYNVALADERKPGSGGQVAPVGNTVNLATAEYSNSIGDAQLSTLWIDPDFNPDVRAFYYLRVLQIPTPRNSLYDAIALQIPPEQVEQATGHPATIQERAYSSPIWYTP